MFAMPVPSAAGPRRTSRAEPGCPDSSSSNLERGKGPRSELIRVLAVLCALGKAVSLTDTPEHGTVDDLLDAVLG